MRRSIRRFRQFNKKELLFCSQGSPQAFCDKDFLLYLEHPFTKTFLIWIYRLSLMLTKTKVQLIESQLKFYFLADPEILPYTASPQQWLVVFCCFVFPNV